MAQPRDVGPEKGPVSTVWLGILYKHMFIFRTAPSSHDHDARCAT